MARVAESMRARVAGGAVERAEAALRAGCDMALVCNRPDLADEVLARLKVDWPAPARARRPGGARQASPGASRQWRPWPSRPGV